MSTTDLVEALARCTALDRAVVASNATRLAALVAERVPGTPAADVWTAVAQLAAAAEQAVVPAERHAAAPALELGRLRAALAWVVAHHEGLEGRLGSDAQAEAVFLAALDGRDPRELAAPLATLTVTLARELAERTGRLVEAVLGELGERIADLGEQSG